jgi:hypothetical protein
MTETATAQETPAAEIALALAEEAAETGARLLKRQGWCLWKCNAFDGDIIVIIRDDPPTLTGQKERMMSRLNFLKKPYTIYTEAELDILCENPRPQLLHEAKKAGATLTAPP